MPPSRDGAALLVPLLSARRPLLLAGAGASAVMLIVFLIFATITGHLRFVRDPVAGMDQVVHSIKNIAIIGGLFNLIAF